MVEEIIQRCLNKIKNVYNSAIICYLTNFDSAESPRLSVSSGPSGHIYICFINVAEL